MYKAFLKFILFIMIVSALVSIFECCRYEQDARDTAFEQFKPSAMLEKYEAFKDLLTKLDEKRALILVYDSQIESLKLDSTMDAKERSYQLSLLNTERIGAIASHNMIAAEYNSRMAKFNYKFTNVGDLPASNLKPLPRDVAEYIFKWYIYSYFKSIHYNEKQIIYFAVTV